MTGLLHLGRPAVDSCPSTQDLCRTLAREGAPEGAVVRAREQTGGRGRLERAWHSPRDLGLWMSFLLRPRIAESEWPFLTSVVVLAAAESLEDLASPRPWKASVKWPNDLLGVHGKLAGILAERVGDALVIGYGLNLGQDRRQFPGEIQATASSLRLEGFNPVPDGLEAARAFDRRLAPAYRRYQAGDRRFLRPGLLKRFHLRNARVRIRAGTRIVEGIAVDLGAGGELRLETEKGIREVIAGEVVSIQYPAM